MKKDKKIFSPEALHGMSIYHDEKRTVYAPFYSKNGYILTNENCKEYKNYVTNYLFAFLVFSLAYIFTTKLWFSVLLGVLFLIGAFIAFYLRFIKKATIIENYKRPYKDNFFLRQAKSLDNKRICTIIICCVLLCLMILLNGKIANYEGSYLYLNYFFAAVALIYGFMNLYIFFLKKKIEEN